MLYSLKIGERITGPHTKHECRRQVEEISNGHAWHWEAQADGSQLAIDDEAFTTLAEAIPDDGV